MTKVAFLGLGVMGFPMAGHLSEAGHEVVVYNRTAAKSEQWIKKYSGSMELTPAKAANGADVVFACVGNDADLRSVVLGDDGAFAGMADGATFVDHTTTSANISRELDEIAKKQGFSFIDAPVSGGQAGAENAILTVMCGGEEINYNKVQKIIDCYARSCELLGPVGSGQLAKMVNQICIAGLVQGLAEGINFAQKAGLDGEAVLKVISKGAAGSWQMDNRGSNMLKDEYEFGFAVDWMRKDLGFCLDEGNRIGAALPVVSLVDQFYKDVQHMGGGRWDTSSLMRRLQAFDK